MNTTPYWSEVAAGGDYPALTGDLETDVLVIGGGITGVTTAWLLAREGRQVVLVERNRLGGGETGHTTAHLTYMTDTRLSELIATFSRRHAQLAWQAGAAAMQLIRETVASLSADCGFALVPGYLAAAEDNDSAGEMARLHRDAGLAEQLGFEVEVIDQDPVTGRPAIRFPGQMKFHPLRYLDALARDAVAHGARIFENTEVTAFEDKPLEVTAGGHAIRYRRVIIATHVPLQGEAGTLGAALFQTKLALYSTYAIAARIPAGSVKEMIWSDTADPFHYLRIEKLGDSGLAILGGEDHKTGQVEDTGRAFQNLERKLARWLPEAVVTHHWSGQVVEPVDGLPYIGEVANHQFIATGFSGNGFTFGTTAAMMARDWVQGLPNPWTGVFKPRRKSPASLKEYLKENADYPVRMIGDRLKTREGDPEDLQPGEAAIMEHDGKRVAAFRDNQGSLHLRSAVCPHLGCIVAWNKAERTWDCPCHGSRFEATGDVIAGPAESALEAISADDS